MQPRQPYKGPCRKLVLAFDIGTTYSGISYCIMEPGLVPEIRTVTKYPSQETVGGDAKIPTIIFYGSDGAVKAVGADALALKDNLDDCSDDSDDESPFLCEWFKLHLRPAESASQVDSNIPSLLPGMNVVKVMADFMRYLFHCAREYITQADPNGERLWTSFGNNIDFVLSHPNGWEGAQQGKMREAAVIAGLIPADEDSQSRIQFVTEGEASLHYCLQNGLATHFRKEKGTIIVDAGGGTIDITAYCKKGRSFKEICQPRCLFNGSIFVTRKAKIFLIEKLQGSNYADDIERMVEHFDNSAKLRFKESSSPAFIKFGTARDKDPKYDIKGGVLKLAGEDIAKFFDPSVDAIIKAVEEMKRSADMKISSIFLVGGFGASDYLFTRLQDHFSAKGVKFCRPDSHLNKAVADGAVSFYLDHFVSERVSRWTYGVRMSETFDSEDTEHLARRHETYIDAAGVISVGGVFDIILGKDTSVSEVKEFRRSYSHRADDVEVLKNIRCALLCYRGDRSNPRWMDQQPGFFPTICTIEADTSRACKNLRPLPSCNGYPPHYRLHFDVVLQFGLTEFKAQIAWKEDGVEKRGPAKIVFAD